MAKLFAVLLAIVLGALTASAQDGDMREVVQRLEKRVAELEAQLKKAPPAEAKPAAAEAPAAAQTPVAPAETAKTESSTGKNGWLWSALLDGYYGYSFNRPDTRSAQLRAFDTTSNQFSLNYAELVLEHPADPLGFRMDIGFGQTADIVNAAEPGGSLLRYVQQAYVSYKAPVGRGLTIDFGKFVTALGSEVIEAKDNYNYSRSLLFTYAIPFYHFGLRATYPVNDKLTVGAQLVNGWNNVVDNNTGKTVHGMVTWAPHKRVSITQNLMSGPESADTNRGWRTMSDTVLSVTASKKLTLLGNYDYGSDRPNGGSKVHWTGFAGGARYAINDRVAIAPRMEWYNDASGFTTGAVQRLKEGTMTLELKLHEGLLTRFEYRRDWSNVPFFDRRGTPGISREQNTLLAGFLFSFASPR